MSKNLIILNILLIYFFSGVICQISNSNESTTNDYDQFETDEPIVYYDKDALYCLRFTWLGPSYDNTSVVNGTCNDLAEEKKLKNTPCKSPLVITHDGTLPNMTYLWENHRDNILCRKARGQSCIKYSYTFNNELQNVTYMCAKAISEGEGPIKNSVCYSQSVNGYVVRSCICQPRKNTYYPCFYNAAQQNQISIPVLLAVIGLVVVREFGARWY